MWRRCLSSLALFRSVAAWFVVGARVASLPPVDTLCAAELLFSAKFHVSPGFQNGPHQVLKKDAQTLVFDSFFKTWWGAFGTPEKQEIFHCLVRQPSKQKEQR